MNIKEHKGRHSYMLKVDDIHVGQTPEIVTYFTKLITEIKIDSIIEIGTHKGGLTYLLNGLKDSSCDLNSFELIKSNIDPKVLESDINLHIGNCFDPKIEDMIKDLIQTSGRVLLLCDGGNKDIEFQVYSKYLKTGDIIMLHDYQDNKSDFSKYQKLRSWNFPAESSYDAIRESAEYNNLEKFMYDDFCSVFWGCYIKK